MSWQQKLTAAWEWSSHAGVPRCQCTHIYKIYFESIIFIQRIRETRDGVTSVSTSNQQSADHLAVSLRLDFSNGKTKKTRSMMENMWYTMNNMWLLPVCQTYCTHTYVLAAKNSHCTGMNSRHIISDVNATHTKNTEKACNTQRDTSDHHMCKWHDCHFTLLSKI